jgi:hypothetical protein
MFTNSLFKSSKSARALVRPQTKPSAPPSNQQQREAPLHGGPSRVPITPREQASRPKERATEPAKITEQMRRRHMWPAEPSSDAVANFEDYNDAPQGTQPRPTPQLLGLFMESENEKNKENRPVIERENIPQRKKRMIDLQPGAERVSWDSQGDDDTESQMPAAKQRPQTTAVDAFVDDEEDEDEDEDAGFQHDDRSIDQSRRVQAAASVATAQQAAQRNQRQSRLTGIEEERNQAAAREQEEAIQSQIRQSSDNNEEEPTATLDEVHQQAVELTRIVTGAKRQTQTRVPWSLEESQALVRLIGVYGSHWSVIHDRGKGEISERRDQVGLKDRARNIKVDYLK